MKRVHILSATAIAIGAASVLLRVLSADQWLESDEINQPRPGASRKNAFIEALEAKYGKSLYSRQYEETFIRDIFKDKKNGVFVDVGAYDYKDKSNTYYLEKHLGWSGIAIDAQEIFREGYEKYRPRTQFFSFYVADKSNLVSDFFIMPRIGQSSGAATAEQQNQALEKREVQTIALNDLLTKLKIEKFDFLNMDIELSEPPALRGFDVLKYRPQLVCIEMHAQVKDQIYEYFKTNGYVELEEYSKRDPLNSYFVPDQAAIVEIVRARGLQTPPQ